MTDQTLPSSGGSYVRDKDGTLRREGAPDTPIAAVEGVVEAPVEAPAKGTAKPVKEA